MRVVNLISLERWLQAHKSATFHHNEHRVREKTGVAADIRNRCFFTLTDENDLFVYKFGKAKEAKAFTLEDHNEPRKVVKVLPSKSHSDLVKVSSKYFKICLCVRLPMQK